MIAGRLATGRGRPSEEGFVAVEWVAAVGLLLLPMAVVVLSFPAWVERQGMARSAAEEAARAVALASDTEAGVAAGEGLVAEIARNHGIDPATMSVRFEGEAVRGGEVRAIVTVQLPALRFPGMGSVGAVDWSTSHTELVDQYRGFEP